jgi:hypothetical protein
MQERGREMNDSQKHAAAAVAATLGFALVAGVIMSFFYTPHSVAVGWKLGVGVVGPFMFALRLTGSLRLLGVLVGWLALCVWLTCLGVARGNRALSIMAAMCLAVTWLIAVFATCILTCLS